MDPDRVCHRAGSGGLDPAVLWPPSLPIRRRWNITLLAIVPCVAVMLARATAHLSSTLLRFHILRDWLTVALFLVPYWQTGQFFQGPNHAIRKAAAGLRPLVDAASGTHRRYTPHRARHAVGNRLPILLSAGAARPACPVRRRAMAQCPEFLAGRADRNLSLLRNHAVCARLCRRAILPVARQPGPRRGKPVSSIAGSSNTAASTPSPSPAPTWPRPLPCRWCCCASHLPWAHFSSSSPSGLL